MWTFGGIRIFVTGKTDETKSVIARLQPIEDSTIHQYLGWEKDITKLVGLIVGEEDKENFRSLTMSGVPFPLSGYGTLYGNYYLSNATFEQKKYGAQTLRTDLDCYTTVFDFTAELYKETD